MSVNKAILIGNLGGDPEIRPVGTTDARVCTLRLATTERWTDKAGQKHELTEWHNVTVWLPSLISVAEKYLHKGSKVYIEGALRHSEWEDGVGNKRTKTEIRLGDFNSRLVLLDPPPARQQTASGYGSATIDAGPSNQEPAQPVAAPQEQQEFQRPLDDEIPF